MFNFLKLSRYVHDPECVATTGDITVSVSTSFLPELSSVHPPHYFFTYRIRWEFEMGHLSVSSGIYPMNALLLPHLTWYIKYILKDGFLLKYGRRWITKFFMIIVFGKYLEFTLTSKLFKLLLINISIMPDTLQGGPLHCNHHERSKLQL